MRSELPIAFESERSQLRRRGEAACRLTPYERLLAAMDALAAAEALSLAAGPRQAQLEYHLQEELAWRNRMREFLAQHARPSTHSA